jgi:hypothetical protein
MMSPDVPSTPHTTPPNPYGIPQNYGPPPWIGVDAPLSLEERLRVIRERCRLLADVFSLQAEATFLACHVSMSADAYCAFTDMCRSSADDLERLAQDLPGAIANWYPEAAAFERCKNPVDGDERP